MDVEEIQKQANALAGEIREALQEFHDETGMYPDVDIDASEVTTFGDAARKYLFRVHVKAEIRSVDGGG